MGEFYQELKTMSNLQSKLNGRFPDKARRALYLLPVVIMGIFFFYPVRRLVISWPTKHQQIIFPVPTDGIFRVLYDTRPNGHQTTGVFQVSKSDKLRFVRMLYRKPLDIKELESRYAPGKVTEDAERVYVHQDIPPVPEIHICVSNVRRQALSLNGKLIYFCNLFPEGALLNIKILRRSQVIWWWLGYRKNKSEPSIH